MVVEWNKVTWYSKIAAVMLFVVTFFLAFWLGTMKAATVYVEVPRLTQWHTTPTVREVAAGSQEEQKKKVSNDIVLKYLGGRYYTDGIEIYKQVWPTHFQYELTLIENFDPSSFSVLDLCWESGNAVHEFYTKDKGGVYCGDTVIQGADPETFRVLNNSVGNNVYDEGIAYLAVDQKHVFIGGVIIENLSSTTFKYIGGNYVGSDAKIYYYDIGNGALTDVIGADTASFQVVPFSMDIPSEDQGYAKDKNQYYQNGVTVHGNIPKAISNYFGPG